MPCPGRSGGHGANAGQGEPGKIQAGRCFVSYNIEHLVLPSIAAATSLLTHRRTDAPLKMTIIDLDLQLRAFQEEFARTAPAGRVALYESKIEALRSDFARRVALKEGDRAPDFSLPGARGDAVSLSSALARGSAVVTFYRGGWR